MNTPTISPNEANAVKPRQFGRILRRLFFIIFTFFLLAVALSSWILWTASGTKAFFNLVPSLSQTKIKFSGIQGRLADHVEFDEVFIQDRDLQVLASGVDLDWQPSNLLYGLGFDTRSSLLKINTISVVSLKISSAPSSKPPILPPQLQLPLALEVNRFTVGRLYLTQLGAVDDKNMLYFSAISGSVNSNNKQHKISSTFNSAWGNVQSQINLSTAKPFAVNGKINYQGQADTAIPAVNATGTMTGDLTHLVIDATVVPTEQSFATTVPAQRHQLIRQTKGGFTAQLAPFSTEPLLGLQLHIEDFDPADINANAPHALLTMHANVKSHVLAIPPTAAKVKNTVQSPLARQLIGQLRGTNARPDALNRNGLPLQKFSSTILWSTDTIALTNVVVDVVGKGHITGAVTMHLTEHKLPQVDAALVLSAVDLAQIDTRLRSTQIDGKFHLQNKDDDVLLFQAQLIDPRARLHAQASYHMQDGVDSKAGMLKIERFELVAADSLATGEGVINLSGKQNFQATIQLKQFDPSHWIANEKARIDADIHIKGNIQPTLTLHIDMPRLEGDYRHQHLSGLVLADWVQDQSLRVDKMDVRWGKNTFNAQGALGIENDVMQVKMDVPEVAVLSSFLSLPNALTKIDNKADQWTGSAHLEASLRGQLAMPSGVVTVHAEKFGMKQRANVGLLDGKFEFGAGRQSAVIAKLTLADVRLASDKSRKNDEIMQGDISNNSGNSKELVKFAEKIDMNVSGKRDAHLIDMSVQFKNGQQLLTNASGGFDVIDKSPIKWKGVISHFDVTGEHTAKLQNSLPLELSTQRVQLGAAQITGSLGTINLEQFEWKVGSTKTRGTASDINIIELVKIFKPYELVEGNLRFNASWDVQFSDHAKGKIVLQRKDGDILINDVEGVGVWVPLGISDAQLQATLGGLIAGTDAERIQLKFSANGARLGQWQAEVDTQVRKIVDTWVFDTNAPVNGNVHIEIPDLSWLAGQISSELAVKGKLSVNAKIAGLVGDPKYQAQIDGRDLELAFAAEGLLLPNGILHAQLNQDIFTLQQLQFSNTISSLPKHAQFQGEQLTKLIGQKGELNASGEVNIRNQTGSILAQWNQFPLLQRKDRWLVMSGQATIVQTKTHTKTQANQQWALTGKMIADGGYFKLPKLPPPNLSSDVVVSHRVKLDADGVNDAESQNGTKAFTTKLDLTLDMGPHFVFVGRGLDTALSGTLRLRGNDGAPVYTSGSIRTNGGMYEGYGQQLDIERGILNFQGSPGNPSLNIRALRRGLAVEAGVDISGTVSAPQVRLVSEPHVPDSEKLSWLVLGRESDQVGGDVSLLLPAMGIIFGGDGSRNIPKELVQGLGFDEFSVGPPENGGGSKLPSQTVAGATAIGAASNDKVVTAGWRLKPGVVLSVERGLSDASGALKLSWQLTRRIRVVGRSGTDKSLDARYTFSFN